MDVLAHLYRSIKIDRGACWSLWMRDKFFNFLSTSQQYQVCLGSFGNIRIPVLKAL